MNKLTPTFGNHAEERTVSALANTVDAVRNPYDCIACDGKGVIRGFGTNDPGERRREVDCLRCGGTGNEPEPETEIEE